MNKKQYKALLRLQLYVGGKIQERVGAYARHAREIITSNAGSDGTLSAHAAMVVSDQLGQAWKETQADVTAVVSRARVESASIPIGTMLIAHKRVFGTALRKIGESMGIGVAFTEAAKVDDLKIDKEAADGVFRPQVKQIVDASDEFSSRSLSKTIWRQDNDAQKGIKAALSKGIADGKSAWDIAQDLEQYLGAGQDCPEWTRQRLYGLTKKQIAAGDRRGLITGDECAGKGVAYNALRLARTEIQRVHARATTVLMQKAPWVKEEQMNLSPSHPEEDICDDIIRDGRDGSGIYPVGEIQLPIHPNCAPAGEMVSTEFGPMPIESVTPGVRVLTHTGNMREVIGTMSRRHTGVLIRIKTASGRVLTVTPEHPILANGAWKEAGQVKEGDDLQSV
jgi:hypothetical protein